MGFKRSGFLGSALLLLLVGACAARTLTQAPAMAVASPPTGATAQGTLGSCPYSNSQLFPTTFTPCGAIGANGPTLDQCRGDGPAWFGNSDCGYWVTKGVQYLNALEAGYYRFTVQGARGGSRPSSPSDIMGGNAANVNATAFIPANTQVALVVGQTGRSDGQDGQGFTAGGGGGASYVFIEGQDSPIIVAAGGGGVTTGCTTYDNSMNTVNGFVNSYLPTPVAGAGGIGKYGNGRDGDAGQLHPAAGGSGGDIWTGALGRSGGGGAAPITSMNDLPGTGGTQYAQGGFGGGGGGGWGGRFENSCGAGGGGGGWIAGAGGNGEDDGGNVQGGYGGSSLAFATSGNPWAPLIDVQYETMGYRTDQYDGSINVEFLGTLAPTATAG